MCQLSFHAASAGPSAASQLSEARHHEPDAAKAWHQPQHHNSAGWPSVAEAVSEEQGTHWWDIETTDEGLFTATTEPVLGLQAVLSKHVKMEAESTDEEAEEEEGEEADNEAASCESCETSMCSTHPPTPDSDPNTDPDNDSDAELSDSCSASSRRCDGAEALQQQQRTQALARATPAIGMAKDRPRSSRGKPKKSQWSATQKLKHSDACRHKERLTLGDKVEIIYLHQEAPVSQRKTQVRDTCSCRHVLTHCQ
jgi:hypothetical protein